MQMKNALLKYQSYDNLFNIGDYIQSLAAEQFLPSVDLFLNRESLNKYYGENVRLIINGWFLHEVENWPPSANINPKFISFHLNSKAYEILEKEKIIDYFKAHEPIGCRDLETVRLFENHGITAYFSACLTLTLGEKYKNNHKKESLYFVDPYVYKNKSFVDMLRYVTTLTFYYRDIKIICEKYYGKKNLRNLLKTSAFYLQYSKLFDSNLLVNAEYVQHVLSETNFCSENEKFNYAKELIHKYAKANLVVTSRIHCALPCLGLETSVLYVDEINKELSSACRLDGLLELINVIKYIKGRWYLNNCLMINPITELKTNLANKDLYLKYKVELISKIKDFIK